MPQNYIPLEPGRYYHIWTHANGSENLFRCKENYRYFLEKYRYYIPPVAETLAYCLMPNHFHFLVGIKEKKEFLTLQGFDKDLSGFKNLTGMVSKQFSNLFNFYTKSFNKVYNRKGSLFVRPFKRKPITSDEYFMCLVAYIHNNPVYHGFVKHPGDWAHSSWKLYLSKEPKWVNNREVISRFGSLDKFFIRS